MLNQHVAHFASTKVPVWSGYNSLIHSGMPLTRIRSPPLVAALAHEWNTLLTILMQAQSITTKAVGPERKTVISLDMGLYQPAKKRILSKSGYKKVKSIPGPR